MGWNNRSSPAGMPEESRVVAVTRGFGSALMCFLTWCAGTQADGVGNVHAVRTTTLPSLCPGHLS